MLDIISASRRTDLPRCFPEVLADWLKKGRVIVRNPFNAKTKEVIITPEVVHTLVLWSKDYSLLLKNVAGLKDLIKSYDQVFFHFTVTGLGNTIWEPGVADYRKVVWQFEKLVKLAGDPERVNWRFDPIILWLENKRVASNLSEFKFIAKAAQQAGVPKVTVSLCQWYPKVKQRISKLGLKPWELKTGQIKRLSTWLKYQAKKHNLSLLACATPELVATGILPASCIDAKLLLKLHPAKSSLSLSKAAGQRQACACNTSIDIGDYKLACSQGCQYCYANPKGVN